MNSTYNENPFILEGYEKVDGVYTAINTASQEQLDWASGIVDFPPYSLISNSTFSNLQSNEGIIRVSNAQLEMRSVDLRGNSAAEAGSSILHATQSSLKLTEKINFVQNAAGTGGAISLNQLSVLEANDTMFSENSA